MAFECAPTSLALCYHRASPAGFYCSCDFSPPSIPSYPVFCAQVLFRATFVSRRCAIIDLFIATLKRGAPDLTQSFCSIFSNKAHSIAGSGMKFRVGMGMGTAENSGYGYSHFWVWSNTRVWVWVWLWFTKFWEH